MRLFVLIFAFLTTVLVYQNCDMRTKLSPQGSLSSDDPNLPPPLDQNDILHPPRNITGTKIGILYFLWHCMASNRAEIYNVADWIAGRAELGPTPDFHYWEQPSEGYYCLSEDDSLLELHAKMLYEAGIEYIVFDSTNQNTQYTYTQNPDGSTRRNDISSVPILNPLRRLLEVWSRLDYAPKVVPWVPVSGPIAFDEVSQQEHSMAEILRDMLLEYPELQLIYQGKPLFLISANQDINQARKSNLELDLTVREMWGLGRENTRWSFLSPCQQGFRESEGRSTCLQRVFTTSQGAEQLSVAVAYQETRMSFLRTAVPKFRGRTFLAQMKTAEQHRDLKFLLITGWNEWIMKRYCFDPQRNQSLDKCDQNPEWEFFPGTQDPIFVDAYKAEYNRDFEPSRNSDRYYRLLKYVLHEYRRTGRVPDMPDDAISAPVLNN